MELRRFNDAGIAEFRANLAASRRDAACPMNRNLLTNAALTEVVTPEIKVEDRVFQTRGDAARYLAKVLAPIPDHLVEKDAGLWTWLALFYFDQLCPGGVGHSAIKNDYQYVFESHNQRHFYRHLLFVGWKALKLSPDYSRLFMCAPASQLDKITEEVMKRLFLTRIRCVFEVLDRLYWDPKSNRPRKGITSPQTVKAGDLMHRFPVRIRQLEKTYDLMSLSADQLLELLGEEFRFAAANPRRSSR